MKANELMIGDLVTFKDCQNDKEMIVVKIWGINQEGDALVFIDDSDSLDEVTIDEEFVGIPLTTEILEKNEFEKWTWNGRRGRKITTYAIGEGFNLEEDDNGFDLVDNCSDSGDYGYESNYITDIKYVHELQHALKLCGIKKTIEL